MGLENLSKSKQDISLACGCASLGNLYKSISDEDAKSTLAKVWDLKYRYFDTAPYYGFGLSERRLGDFLRGKKDYILSTKVGRILKADSSYNKDRAYYIDALNFKVEFDYSYDGIMRSYEDSLQRLGLDKIDILYMHDIGAFTHGDLNKKYMKIAMTSGLKALESLKAQGLIKAFGLGVNETQVCEEALSYGSWDCFLLASRYTLLEQDCISTLFPKCKKQGISLVLGGVYASGILASGAVEGAKYNYDNADTKVLKKVQKMEEICKKYELPLACVALNFILLNDLVYKALIGSSKDKHFAKALEYSNTLIPKQLWQDFVKEGLILEQCFDFN